MDTVMTKSSAPPEPVTTPPALPLHHSPWVIPLTEYWKNGETFVLLIPDSSGGIVFDTQRSSSLIRKDTVQGKILETLESDLQLCDENKLRFKVALGAEQKEGIVDCSAVQAIGALDLGKYTIADGRQFQLGAMKVKSSGDTDNGCPFVHTLFLYDAKNILLIEAGNSDLHGAHQRHLSIVNQVPGISVGGQTQGNQFVISWSEPNVTNELRLEWAGDHARFVAYDVNNLESDVADLPDDPGRD